MLYSCNLFQPQIKHVAFTSSLQCSLWVIHKAVRTCLHVLWESFPSPCFCDGAGRLGVDAVHFQVKTSISFPGQAGVKGCCEVFSFFVPSTSVCTWLMTGRWQELPLLAGAFKPSSGPEDSVSSATLGVSAASLPKVVVRVFVSHTYAQSISATNNQ